MCVQISDLQTELMLQMMANPSRSQVLSLPLVLHQMEVKHLRALLALMLPRYQEMKCSSVNLRQLQTMLLVTLREGTCVLL